MKLNKKVNDVKRKQPKNKTREDENSRRNETIKN